jgi:hypothetical protein
VYLGGKLKVFASSNSKQMGLSGGSSSKRRMRRDEKVEEAWLYNTGRLAVFQATITCTLEKLFWPVPDKNNLAWLN